ncbi:MULTISPECIES: plastocyanin/azurin family copper-binding protein [unclassified Natrinema]|uniref:plastocyanin/azurin family copper-binding protein n=1 Tax=unclassified Natrinema TaxID=2622230 RepID=UPI00026D4D2A|nr:MULTISPECIES: plastocyanin/azurin family copper-binding protein [unclassified Natrinema]AFO55821.1 Blue copper domain protein [Natrinema sp. J7-2]
MARDNPVSRRTALKLTGAAASTALVAGCSSGGNGNGNGNGDGNGGSEGPYTIESGTEIKLKSKPQDWEGLAPSKIKGVENPDLSLTEGESYTITWAKNESGRHNLAVYDDSESPVAGPTEKVSDSEPGLSVKFKASSDTVEYVCQPHYGVGMKGNIKLE